jgi:uncharacterized membrane protein
VIPLTAILAFVLWVVLAFVLAIPSGWVHVPLMAAALLAVKGIVDGGARRAE